MQLRFLRLRTRRVERALHHLGCVELRHSPNGHRVYLAPSGKRCGIPLSHPDIGAQTLKQFCERVDLDWERVLDEY
jgi:predicted RNA binding protein YcfA (HicA-like mRNA interferase family)